MASFILRRQLQLPTFVFFLVVALELFVAVITRSTTLVLRQYHPVEAFVSLNIPAKRINRRTRTFDSSHCSIFIPNMTSRNDNDNDRRNPGYYGGNKRRQQGNDNPRQQQQQKHPRRKEATTNAAPMYITIGKTENFN